MDRSNALGASPVITEADALQRIQDLLARAKPLARMNANTLNWDQVDQYNYEIQREAQATAWVTAAMAVIEATTPGPASPYHRMASAIFVGTKTHYRLKVAQLAALLEQFSAEIQAGLLASVWDEALKATIGSMVDQASRFLDEGQQEVASVLAGVAFEDAMRRLRAMRDIQPDDIKLENLIAALEKEGVFGSNDGRHARAAAALRTSATHARWSEITRHHVDHCIRFTRQIIDSWLPAA